MSPKSTIDTLSKVAIELRFKELALQEIQLEAMEKERQFREKQMYLEHLDVEHVADTSKWPKTVWTLLLQSVLVGKA